MNSILRNIAPQGRAFQSSLSGSSYSCDEAKNALIGYAPKGYAFHTKKEKEAWWACDLNKVYPIHSVKVFKRDGHEYRYKNDTIHVLGSEDLSMWYPLGSLKSTSLYAPFTLNCDNKKLRFLKFVIYNQPLHLRQIEIFTDENLVPYWDIFLLKNYISSKAVLNAILNNNYEDIELNLVLKNINQNDVILELGGSIGAVSTVILSRYPNLAYTTLEANPELIPIIKENHKFNNVNCNIIQGAVGESDGKIEFSVNFDSFSSSISNIPSPNIIKKIDVQSYTLNSLLKQTMANFLICDIEGAEFLIFKDNVELFNLNKICIEFHNKNHGGNIERFNKLYNFFISKGFRTKSAIPDNINKHHILYFYKN